MINPITIQRWNLAQVAERALHSLNMDEGIKHYKNAYSHNFRYCGIDASLTQRCIIEIGCADFPALRYVKNDNCMIVEPMPSAHLLKFCDQNEIELIKTPFEDLVNRNIGDYEIWMFNVLQHTIDPELFINIAKRAAVVRYFEPIETGTTDYHPHSFSRADFDRWFPEVNEYCNETTNAGFHDGPCCYGVYMNPNYANF